jgi:hypothetical protein
MFGASRLPLSKSHALGAVQELTDEFDERQVESVSRVNTDSDS